MEVLSNKIQKRSGLIRRIVKKIFGLSLLIAICGEIYAGDPEILVFDKESKKPVSWANVCFEGLKTSDKHYEVTTVKGVAQNPVREASEIAISFVGYKTIRDTIGPNESKTYFMEQDLFGLDQVVVTGELKPTLTDNSIYRIKTISGEKIKQAGATNLSELLLTESNIRLTADLVLGSRIEMMGMDGENVKIMIDGIPVIGRLSGNIDLSQINLSNIDHIEIIEGPMSVVYGNNALAGTINLITKTGSKQHQTLKVGTQIESAEKYEADFFASKGFGNHNLALNAQASYFDGVDFDTSTRSSDWKPKTQYLGGANYNWNNKKWKINAKVNLYYGSLLVKSDITDGYKAYDTYYYTERYDGSLGLIRNWGKNRQLNLQVAYNYYDRKSQDLFKNLTTLQEIRSDKESSQDNRQKILKCSYGHYNPSLRLDILSGVDLDHQKMGGPRLQSDYESLGDYAVFLTLKYQLTDKIEFQPGVRYAYNTDFDSPVVYSLNLKYNLFPQLTWRASLAKGFRAPSLKELYYEFNDSNHKIYGNSDLKAEYSQNINTSFLFKTERSMEVILSAFYNNVHDRIDLVENSANSDGYTYYNISRYKSTGTDVELKYRLLPNLKFDLGGGLTGRYNSFSDENQSRTNNIAYDFFSGIHYTETYTRIRCFADYKYNGSLPFFFKNDDGEIEEGEQDSYHLLNASLSRNFIRNKLLLTLGARNLLDVTSVKITGDSGSSAHSSGSSTAISYGRSFFIHITYNF